MTEGAPHRHSNIDLHLLVISSWLVVDLQYLIAVFLQQKPAPQAAPSPTPPPHIVYNPTQHMLTYAGFCPSGQALPAYPNYPIPIQVGKKTHLYTTGMHDNCIDECLMMSSERPARCKSENKTDTEDLSSDFVSLHVSAAQRQLPASCDPSACSWSGTGVQRLPVWGEPEPAASSGRHPAAASWSQPGSGRLHADP